MTETSTVPPTTVGEAVSGSCRMTIMTWSVCLLSYIMIRLPVLSFYGSNGSIVILVNFPSRLEIEQYYSYI
jgi:hypothetical protein